MKYLVLIPDGMADRKIAELGGRTPLEAAKKTTMNELAAKCDCGEATIVRFARRLGLSGYQELKISLARESGNVVDNHDVAETDTLSDIFEKVTNDIYKSLEMTKQSLSPSELDKAANAIISARKIAIFGLGNSSPVAQDAGHKFFRAGCDAYVYSDNHMQAIAASHLKEGDVALGISHSGSSKDIVDALKTAKKGGATTISITS